LKAQVTIGSLNTPSSNALLDLKEAVDGTSTKGLLLSRVSLQSTASPAPMQSHEEGLFVYNTVAVSDVTPGIYYNDGTKWHKVGTAVYFFYMPSIFLPLDTSDPAYNTSTQTFTVDLHAQYVEQFSLALMASVRSPGAVTPLPLHTSTELHYFVTYFDSAVFQNVMVDNHGVMTYQLVSSPVLSEKTFMNIIFQVNP
jgi:hypothetical protein